MFNFAQSHLVRQRMRQNSSPPFLRAMKKSERISSFVSGLGGDPASVLHPCYQGYFTCFNAAQYYEAHDVLEHLWLTSRDAHFLFYKG